MQCQLLSREGLNELIAANRITAGTDVDRIRDCAQASEEEIH
jgi:hypothetical protein